METGTAIQVLRKKRNISQRELAKTLNVDHGVIARLERNQSIPTFDLIIDIINKLNATLDDLFYVKDLDTHYNHYVTEYYKTDNTGAESAFKYFSDNKNLDTKHYFFYIKTKIFFAPIIDSIPEITEDEYLDMYNHIINSPDYTIFDYELISTVLPDMSQKLSLDKIKQILNNLLPISIEINIARDINFRAHIRRLYNNAIGVLIIAKDYTQADTYLDFYKRYLKEYPNMQHNALAMYNEDVLKYIRKKNKKSIRNIEKNIKLHKLLKASNTAKGMQYELDNLKKGKHNNNSTDITVDDEY